MSKYYIWEDYTPGHRFASVSIEDGLSIAEVQDIRYGRKMTPESGEFVVHDFSRGPIPDVISTGWRGRLVNISVREVLTDFCGTDHLQFYPVRFETERPVAEEYSLMNIAFSVPCLDRDKSEFKADKKPPYAIEWIKKLVLKETSDSEYHLFHMEELKHALIISHELAGAIKNVSEKAGKFLEVSEFTYGVATPY